MPFDLRTVEYNGVMRPPTHLESLLGRASATDVFVLSEDAAGQHKYWVLGVDLCQPMIAAFVCKGDEITRLSHSLSRAEGASSLSEMRADCHSKKVDNVRAIRPR